jgi:hypothetical protein
LASFPRAKTGTRGTREAVSDLLQALDIVS